MKNFLFKIEELEFTSFKKKYFINKIIFVIMFFLFLFLLNGCAPKEPVSLSDRLADALVKKDFKKADSLILEKGLDTSFSMVSVVDTTERIDYYKILFFLEENEMNDVITSMFEQGFDPNYCIYQFSLLSRACADRRFSLVKLLVENGADVDFDYDINVRYFHSPLAQVLSPIFDAYDTSYVTQLKIINYLLDKGATPDLYFIVTNRPYSSVPGEEYKDLEHFKLLIKYGGKLVEKNRQDGASVLQIISWAREDQRILHYLISEMKVELEYCDKNGWTALHYAAEVSNAAAVKILLAAGANKYSKTKEKYCILAPDIANGMPRIEYECYQKDQTPYDILTISYENHKADNSGPVISEIDYKQCLELLK